MTEWIKIYEVACINGFHLSLFFFSFFLGGGLHGVEFVRAVKEVLTALFFLISVSLEKNEILYNEKVEMKLTELLKIW